MTVWVKLHVNVFCVLEGCVNLCILQVLSTYASRCALFVVVGVTMWVDKLVTQFSYYSKGCVNLCNFQVLLNSSLCAFWLL